MIEKFLSLFERLVAAVEVIAAGVKKEVELDGRQAPEPAAKETPVFKEIIYGLREEEPSVSGRPLTYEELLEEHGLPYLKELCEKRGLNFPKLARSNTIIALLKDHEKCAEPQEEPEKMVGAGSPITVAPVEVDPFAVETPVVEDPFATTSAPEPVKEVTEEELRDKLKDLRDVFESKNAGKGTLMIIDFMEKKGGVRILKELPKEKYAVVMKSANDEILRLLK